MPARWERTRWAIAARQAAVILLLTAVIDEAAAGQSFDPNPRAVGSPSSSGAIAPALDSRLPPNLGVPGIVRPLVTSMWRLSPTFRRQCARLAEHPEILADIELRLGVSNGRANALVERSHGGYHAAVEIEVNKPALYVELHRARTGACAGGRGRHGSPSSGASAGRRRHESRKAALRDGPCAVRGADGRARGEAVMRAQWTAGVSSISVHAPLRSSLHSAASTSLRIGSPVMKRDSSRHKESRTIGLAP